MKLEEIRGWIRTSADISFSRSAGPGGQNVNKVNTKATVRISLSGDAPFADEELRRLRNKLGTRINKDGDLVVQMDRFRSQLRNREGALAVAEELILSALHRARKRYATTPRPSAKDARLREKRRRSDTKQHRGRVSDNE